MEFACKTVYDHKTLAAMSKALRRTTRKKPPGVSGCSSRAGRPGSGHSHGRIPEYMASGDLFDGSGVSPVSAVEGGLPERLFCQTKGSAGTDVCRAHFYPEFYETEIAGVQTQWQYTKVQALVETKDYIILILGKNQAQAYDKRGLEGRSVREFCGFLSRKTGLHVQTFLR